jgi:hypothetical protein
VIIDALIPNEKRNLLKIYFLSRGESQSLSLAASISIKFAKEKVMYDLTLHELFYIRLLNVFKSLKNIFVVSYDLERENKLFMI